MSHAKLTSTSFEAALAAIENAKTEKACAAALVTAASMVQGAVLGGQSLSELMSLFESCAMDYPSCVSAVVDRAIDAHELDDGGQLRLWLVPVAITSEVAFASSIPLKKTGMDKLRVESMLQGAMGLRAAPSATQSLVTHGWVQALPGLYAEDALKLTDVCELVRLPHRMRSVLRGSSKGLRFAPEAATASPGVQMFYLPVVSYAAPGSDVSEVESSIQLAAALTQWARASLPAEYVDVSSFQACTTAHSFSLAFGVGARMKREVSIKDMLESVVQNTGVLPSGLSGLVALYQPQGTDTQFIGVTLTSRLMKETVGLLNVQVDTEDGLDELAQVSQVLRDAGVARVMVTQAPVATYVCQHCNYPQYLNLHPSQMAGVEDVCDPKGRLH